VKSAISDVPGVADLGIVKSGEVPNLLIEPRRDALARYGVALEELQHIIQAAMGGTVAGELWEGERRFDIVLRYPIDARNEVEKLKKLAVPIGGGLTIPLENLANIQIGFGRASISRENGKRYIGIRMNVRGRDLGTFVSEAQARVTEKAPLPAGIRIEWGGEFENKERAMARLLLVVPLAILITLVLLFNAFRRMAPAVLTLLNVPFAVIGGLAGLALAGMPISVAAAVGFISLIGLASLNGVLLLSAVIERRESGTTLDEAIVEGCVERLRPVLLTAALAALGLLPAALSRGIGSETQKPIAIVIVGGTMSAALMSLVVLPVMYKLWVRFAERFGIGVKAAASAAAAGTEEASPGPSG
jgi:cobalt-zinc-cadmium resistance protein CzcA